MVDLGRNGENDYPREPFSGHAAPATRECLGQRLR
jgi:hypothetical protein